MVEKFHSKEYCDAFRYIWQNFFLRSGIYGCFLGIFSRLIVLKNHRIKFFFLGLYSIFGLFPWQAKFYPYSYVSMMIPYPVWYFTLIKKALLKTEGTALAFSHKMLEKNFSQSWCVNLQGGYTNVKQNPDNSIDNYNNIFNDVCSRLNALLQIGETKILIIDLSSQFPQALAEYGI